MNFKNIFNSEELEILKNPQNSKQIDPQTIISIVQKTFDGNNESLEAVLKFLFEENKRINIISENDQVIQTLADALKKYALHLKKSLKNQ